MFPRQLVPRISGASFRGSGEGLRASEIFTFPRRQTMVRMRHLCGHSHRARSTDIPGNDTAGAPPGSITRPVVGRYPTAVTGRSIERGRNAQFPETLSASPLLTKGKC